MRLETVPWEKLHFEPAGLVLSEKVFKMFFGIDPKLAGGKFMTLFYCHFRVSSNRPFSGFPDCT
jgi:hypothetical protein